MNDRPPFPRRTPFVTSTLVCALFSSALTAAAADDWHPYSLTVTGSKSQTWVVASSAPDGEGLSEIRFWWCGPKPPTGRHPTPGVSLHLPPISGNAQAIAANSDGLQILFSNQSLWEYSLSQEGRIIASWKSQASAPPIAWAGDDSNPIFWAIVDTSALTLASTQPTSQPEMHTYDTIDSTTLKLESRRNLPPDPFTTPSADPVPATGRTLMRFRRGFWNRIPTFADLDKAERIWLAGRNERAYVFFDNGAGDIRFAEYIGGKWDAPEDVIKSADVQCAWAGSTRTGPVLIAGIGKDIRTVHLHLFTVSVQGQWTESGVVREGDDDYLTVDGLRTGVGVAMDRLALARIGERDQVEFASADPEGSPMLHFAPLSTSTPLAEDDAPWDEIAVPMIALAVTLSILLVRREDVMLPAAIPMNYELAAPWKRGVATMIDLIPGIIISFASTIMIFPELGEQQSVDRMMEIFGDPANRGWVLTVNCISIGVYSLWCMLWELGSGTTPGKRIFGCRVLGINGSAPSARQIIVRNAIRFVMFMLFPTGVILTFIAMVMLTRNNQRVGDALARTMVIQSNGNPDIPVARPPNDRSGL